MRILILEDELILAYAMQEMLITMGYTSIIIESKFINAVEIINTQKIDLALLDINIGKGETGIDLAKLCNEKSIPFLYTTSYTDKATLDKALETNPGAYLIKPITESSLYTTIQIILNQQKNSTIPVLEFKDGTALIKLPLNQVLYLKSENIYVNVISINKTYLYRGSLGSLIEKLPSGSLVQTHRAYAINPEHVVRLSSNFVQVNDFEIPISRNYKQHLT